MKITRLFATAFTALLVALPLVPARAAALQPGQILIDNFSAAAISQYSAAGTLLQSFTGSDIQWSGIALTPTGSLVTASRGQPSVKLFAATGAQITSFSSGVPSNPFDVSVFADGTLALTNGTSNVLRFSQSGTLLSTTTLTGISAATGSTVGSNNILYVADGNSKSLGMMDSSGKFLGTLALNFFPADLVMSALDGTLWISDQYTDTIHHYTTAGVSLGSLPTGFTSSNSYGIGIAPDGNSLYSVSSSSTTARHLSLTGTLLDSFTVPTGSLYLTVVPAPEPGSVVLVGAGMLTLLARRRRPPGSEHQLAAGT